MKRRRSLAFGGLPLSIARQRSSPGPPCDAPSRVRKTMFRCRKIVERVIGSCARRSSVVQGRGSAAQIGILRQD